MIDPPVSVFSTVDEILAWQHELRVMRLQYRDDPEALRCIARAEDYATHLANVVPTLPKVVPQKP